MEENPPDLSGIPRDRRLMLLEGLGEALGLERELAGLYERLVSSLPPTAPVELVAGLARETQAHADRVRELILALGGSPRPPVSGDGPGSRSRGELYARAFEAERRLLGGYRDLAALLGGAALLSSLAALAADESRHLQRLVELYRRYS